MTHFEKKLSGETVLNGIIINVEHDKVLLENGQEAMREVVRHRGAVAILAVEDGEILLVRQFRYPLNAELLEIPAGKLEAGEEPLPAAFRELKEETGGICGEMIPLGSYYGSPGICDEKIWLYFARITGRGETHPDEDEFLTLEKYTPAQLDELIARGEVQDGKTLSALVLARSRGLL